MPRKRPAQRAFQGRLVGLPPDSEGTTATAVLTAPPISEAALRDRFGVDNPKERPEIPKSFRQLFNLQPEDVMAFFDTQLGTYAVFEEVEVTIGKDVLRRHVKHIQCLINEHEKIVGGLSVRVMKIRRAPDDVLDKETREKYKRDEEKKLTRLYSKRARLRAAIASPLDHRVRVWRTVEKPLYFRDLVEDWMAFDKTLIRMEIDGEWTAAVTRGAFDLQSYRDIMRLDAGALAVIEDNAQAWDNLRVWENNVIAAAVVHGLYQPRRDLAELLGFPDLVKQLNEQVAVEDFEQAALDLLPEQILETERNGDLSGGTLTGRIRVQTAGFRYRKDGTPVARPLSSFDRPTRIQEGVKSPVTH